jgi:membrane fusion protein, multidrug efflux system
MSNAPSFRAARLYVFLIIAIVGVWLLSGIIMPSKKAEEQKENQKVAADTIIEITEIAQQTIPRTTEIYGVTEAERDVNITAQTQGEVKAILAKEGKFIKEGAPIIRIDMNDRKERLDAAHATVQQRQQEYNAALKLKEKGFESDVAVTRALAALNNAVAEHKAMNLDIGFTTVRAPFSGILEKVNVEQGDFAGVGVFGVEGAIARVLDLNPLIAKAEVTSQDKGLLTQGGSAIVTFPDGTKKQAILRYISQAATQESRAFPVEVAIPNDDYALPAGTSVTIGLSLENVEAHIIPAALLSLKDDGSLSVKGLNDNNEVVVYDITILSEAEGGVVVQGLPDTVNIISKGQNFVNKGDVIDESRLRFASK